MTRVFTPERWTALEQEARSWQATPFILNARTKGEGVSCHNLVYGIFENLGVRLSFSSPRGSGGVGDQTRLRRISSFFADCEEFRELAIEANQPGDVISFRVSTGEYHIGLRLPDRNGQTQRFIHSIKPWGACIGSLADPTYARRIEGAWEVLE